MVDRTEVLAIIPARGGSKGLPRKNIARLGGVPLIAYSVSSALASETVTRTVVSTDDREIARIAEEYGAEIPFLRPPDLATDQARDLGVIKHALDRLKEIEGYEPAVVVQLRPTSPLRPAGLVDDAVRLLLSDPESDSVRTVTSARENPYKMWRKDRTGYLRPIMNDVQIPEPYNAARQELPPTLWQTGHIDAIRTSTVRQRNSLTGDKVLPLLVERSYCIDIDVAEDLGVAERVLWSGSVEIEKPRRMGRKPFVRTELLVLDFDGVLTDDKVWVGEDGRESVRCSRADGRGLEMLRNAGMRVAVLSREPNPVVARRCEKLRIECHQAIDDKERALMELVEKAGTTLDRVVYVGKDLNDLSCMKRVGLPIAVADAHREVVEVAELVLSRRGGDGAMRQLCELLLKEIDDGKKML